MLAGAGTGKTRAITHRIAYGVATGVYAPTEVLAVTFTTRAAGEMRGRLRQLGAAGVQARTFHSAALRQLRYFWPRTYGGELPTLTESKIGWSPAPPAGSAVDSDQALLRDLASEIEWAKVSNVGPDDYAARRARPRPVGQRPRPRDGRPGSSRPTRRSSATRAGWTWRTSCCSPPGMLAEDERVAAQVRAQYKWFVVDEFQDVSPIQSALLDLWLGGRDELCVVGDPAQTIYSFAGANARYLRDFPASTPDAVSLELVRNYRSTPEVVTAANTLLDRHAEPGRRPARPAARPGPAVDLSTPTPTRSPRPRRWPTRIVALRERGRAAGRDRRAVPDQRPVRGLRGGAGRPAASPTSSAAPRGSSSGRRCARRSPCCAAPPGPGQARRRRRRRRARHPRPAWAGRPSAPTARGQTRDRWESLQALVDQAVECATAQPGADLDAFVDELDRRAAEQHAPVAGGVTLATLHAAKGLEWDAVFLCGLQEGTLPIIYAETPAAVEEERRLLYVGMTRARRHLALSWAWPATPAAARPASPSRFLDGLRPADEAVAPGGGAKARRRRGRSPAASAASRWHRRGEEDRPLRDCPASYDEELFERLRAWRLERAGRRQGAGVRGVHRRHAAAHRRAPADHAGGPAAHQRHRPGQARALRRGSARGESGVAPRRVLARPGRNLPRNSH